MNLIYDLAPPQRYALPGTVLSLLYCITLHHTRGYPGLVRCTHQGSLPHCVCILIPLFPSAPGSTDLVTLRVCVRSVFVCCGRRLRLLPLLVVRPSFRGIALSLRPSTARSTAEVWLWWEHQPWRRRRRRRCPRSVRECTRPFWMERGNSKSLAFYDLRFCNLACFALLAPLLSHNRSSRSSNRKLAKKKRKVKEWELDIDGANNFSFPLP